MKISNFLFLALFALLAASCQKDEMPTTPNDNTPTTPVTPPAASFTALRAGTFTGQNGYAVSGKTQLGKDAAGTSIVRLDTDFKSAFPTGSTTIYLSKNQALKLSDASSFVRLATINTNGLHDFPLAAAPTADFKFVIVWCTPASIQFGNAELK